MFRVWTHSPFQQQALDVLPPGTEAVTGERPASDAWYALALTCDAMILSGTHIIDGPVLDRLGSRTRIAARTGIGYDAINVDDATARGVLVINTPDGPTEPTAEHAIALIMNLAKGVAFTDRMLRSGDGFPRYGSFPPGLELRGATLGLVGFGRIGARVAEMARVIGMRVLAYDPFASRARADALGVILTDTLEEVLSSSDVVSIHCPAMPETRKLINARTLSLMRQGSYFVNVARGSIVDEDALVAALESGHLAGAGLDVFDPEPTVADHPLYRLPNTICTPHVASYTAACVLRMQIQACEQVAMALRGERPNHLVDPSVWERYVTR
jgi:D-3-phosphoglycerate dehydrogenase / 2-oxoglutarate reductase